MVLTFLETVKMIVMDVRKILRPIAKIILYMVGCITLGIIIFWVGIGGDWTRQQTLDSQKLLSDTHDAISLGMNYEEARKIVFEKLEGTRITVYEYDKEDIVANAPLTVFSLSWSLAIKFCKDTVFEVMIRDQDDNRHPENAPEDKLSNQECAA